MCIVFPDLITGLLFRPFQPWCNCYGSNRCWTFFLANPAANTGFPDRGPEVFLTGIRMGPGDKNNCFFIFNRAFLKTDLTGLLRLTGRLWREEADIENLRIIGYRNVWYRFHPAEADVIVPVSLNSLSTMDKAFTDCYLSQVEASFPSYMYDGKFSILAEKIWIDQMKHVQLLLGKNYFYENESARLRGAHGLLYYRDMDIDTFLDQARKLEKSTEGF